MTTATATLTLWLLMDPLGNLPVFSSVLGGVDPARRRFVLVRELVLALLFLVGFLLLGKYVFGFLHLDPSSVRIAGALILAMIAYRMLFGSKEDGLGGADGHEPLLFPLAVPMLVGPATLSLLLLWSSNEPARMGDWLLAILGAWAGAASILACSGGIGRLVGVQGLTVMEKLMGMLLTCLAVQMLVEGVSTVLVARA